MGILSELHKNAVISCIEIILMSQGNTKYNLVIAKLMARDVAIRDFNQHLEYFRDVLREVYGNDYGRITKEIKGCLDDLVLEKDIAEFFKIMES